MIWYSMNGVYEISEDKQNGGILNSYVSDNTLCEKYKKTRMMSAVVI